MPIELRIHDGTATDTIECIPTRDCVGHVSACDVTNPTTGEIVAECCERITLYTMQRIANVYPMIWVYA